MFPRLLPFGMAVLAAFNVLAQDPERQLDLVPDTQQAFSITPYTFSFMAARSDLLYAAAFGDSKGWLLVINVADPERPELIGQCEVAGAIQVSLGENHAFVTGQEGVYVVEISDPTAPRVVKTHALLNARRGVIAGNLLYVTASSELVTLDISSPEDPKFLSSLALSEALDFALAGPFPYGYVATGQARIHVIDMSDPANPAFVKTVIHSSNSRDIQVANGAVYVAADGGGLMAFDISDPANPVQIGQHRDGWAPMSIEVRENLAYLGVRGGGCRVIDVSDPANMKLAGQLMRTLPSPTPDVTYGLGITETHIFFGMTFQTTRLEAIKVTEANWQRLGGTPVISNNLSVAPGQKNMLMGARNLVTVDISNLSAPMPAFTNTAIQFSAIAIATSGNRAVAATSQSLYVLELSESDEAVIKGQTSFSFPPGGVWPMLLLGNIAVTGGNSFQLVDVSDPAQPQVLGTVHGSWGSPIAYLTADGNRVGIVADRRPYLLDFTDPQAPVVIGEIATVNTAYAVAIAGDVLWVVHHTDLMGFDMSNPAEPVLVSTMPIRGQPEKLVLDGTYLYVMEWINGVEIFDISDAAAPVRVGGNSAMSVDDLVVRNGYGFAVADRVGFSTYAFANETMFRLMGAGFSAEGFEFTIEGAPGNSVIVERSVDLEEWSEWETIDASASNVRVTDEPNQSRRFYRVKAVAP